LTIYPTGFSTNLATAVCIATGCVILQVILLGCGSCWAGWSSFPGPAAASWGTSSRLQRWSRWAGWSSVLTVEVISATVEVLFTLTVEVLAALTEEVLSATVEVLSATVEVLSTLTAEVLSVLAEEVLFARICWASAAKSCVGLLMPGSGAGLLAGIV
jgi:hypothetical protein